METITDEKLMQQVAKGDLDQLKVLFERHHVHVFNFLNKMTRDRMLSEDMTQEVFYKIMKYRTTYANGRFVAWMFTIARNNLKTYYSRKKERYDSLDEKLLKTIDDGIEASLPNHIFSISIYFLIKSNSLVNGTFLRCVSSVK